MPPKKAAAKKPWVKYTQWDSDRVYYWNSRTDVYTLKEPDEGHEETVDEDDADGFEEEYTKAERFDAGELRSATLPSGARVAVSNKTAAGPPSPSPSAAAAKVSVLLIGDGAEDATVRADDPGLAAEGFETCIVPTMLGVPLVIKKLKRPRCAKVDPLDERNLLVQLLMMSPKDGSAPDVRLPPRPYHAPGRRLRRAVVLRSRGRRSGRARRSSSAPTTSHSAWTSSPLSRSTCTRSCCRRSGTTRTPRGT